MEYKKLYSVEEITKMINSLFGNTNKPEENLNKSIINKKPKEKSDMDPQNIKEDEKKCNDINEMENEDKEGESRKEEKKKHRNEKDKEKEKFDLKGQLYIYKDENDNKKVYYYLFHRKRKTTYDLRCKDRNCKSTASLEKDDKFHINTEHSLAYEEHNYIKEIIAYNKIKTDEVKEEEMKSEYYQKAYFKLNIELFPCIKYEDILFNFTKKFPNINKIIFNKTKFFNLKNEMQKELINYDKNLKTINNLELYGEPLLKENFEFYKEDGTKAFIKKFQLNKH